MRGAWELADMCVPGSRPRQERPEGAAAYKRRFSFCCCQGGPGAPTASWSSRQLRASFCLLLLPRPFTLPDPPLWHLCSSILLSSISQEEHGNSERCNNLPRSRGLWVHTWDLSSEVFRFHITGSRSLPNEEEAKFVLDLPFALSSVHPTPGPSSTPGASQTYWPL